MPEIRITYGKHAFSWTATEEEAAGLLAYQRERATQLGDPDAVLNTMVEHAPALLDGNPNEKGCAMEMLTAWALNLSTQQPERPGRVIDYLPAYDFAITIEQAAKGVIRAALEAKLRDEIAGSA